MKKTEIKYGPPFDSKDAQLKKAYKYFVKFTNAFDQRKDRGYDLMFFHLICMLLVVLAKNMKCSKNKAIDIFGECFDKSGMFIGTGEK